ncbi:MAG: hypothetical protein FWE91_04020 [Defluviitaleaceae bacterium]|nr:hypothetical protein [Defluviitaleaceae bacterium]MCL2837237.1 hypothetical protein [Defluviitaleaceae bacterium]
MKTREFIYIGEPIPSIDVNEHKEFLTNVQKAMLLSLVERKLLTKIQAERVLDELTIRSRIIN